MNQRGLLSDRQRGVLEGLPSLALYTGIALCAVCLYVGTWIVPWLWWPLVALGGGAVGIASIFYLKLKCAVRDPVICKAHGPCT